MLFLLIACGTIGRAQSGGTTGALAGTVKDVQGAALAGASVRVRQLETGLDRMATADERGIFRLVQLPPGTYEVTAQAEGFASARETLKLTIGITVLVEFVLEPGNTNDAIEVRASNPLAAGRTESSTINERARIDNLPINRRTFLDFSLTAPRVISDRLPDQGFSATSGLSVNGQPGRFNNITIDGLDNNENGTGAVRATFSQDAVQEFQVLSDSYSAEFGRAIGGVINIVTRGGSNEAHGTLFLFNRNNETSARDAFAPSDPDFSQYQFGAALSGPVKRERVFFFNSFERQSVAQNSFITISDAIVTSARRQGFPITNGIVPFSVGSTTLLARLDARLSARDMLTLRYNYGGTYNGSFEPPVSTRRVGGLISDTSGGIQQLNDNSIALTNVYINANLKLVNETRALVGRRTQLLSPIVNEPQIILGTPAGDALFGRNPFLPQPREERICQIVNNVSLARGRHQIKFGADMLYTSAPGRKTFVPMLSGGAASFQQLDFSALTGIPGLPSLSPLEAFDATLRTPPQRAFLNLLAALLPNMFAGFPRGLPVADLPLPLAFLQGFGDTRLSLDFRFVSLFVQDDFQPRPNLMIKFGGRYDVNTLRFAPNRNENFNPRLGIAYRARPRLNLRANYGIFHGIPLAGLTLFTQPFKSNSVNILFLPFPFSILPGARPERRFPESNQLPAGVPFTPQLSFIFQYADEVRDTYAHQGSAGFDYLIGKETLLSASYNLVRGVKVTGGRNINPVVRPVPDDFLQSLQTGRVDAARGDVIEFESAFDSYYHALTLTVNRRFSERLGFLANYTFSKAIDNALDVRTDFLDEPVDPLRPGDERGLSIQDVRSRFLLSGIWEPNYSNNPLLRGYQLSTIVTLESGRPYNLLAGRDLNNNNVGGDRPGNLGRNVGRLPGFASVDVRVTRSVTIKDRVRLQAIAEAFNLFNRVNIDQINTVFTPGSQLPPQQGRRFIAPRERFRSSFAPRQLQFGLRISF